MYLEIVRILPDQDEYLLDPDSEFNVAFYEVNGSQLKYLFTIFRVFQFIEYKNRYEVFHCYCNKYSKSTISKYNILWRYV